MSVQLPPNSTGTIIDTTTLSGKDRQNVSIGDGATAANVTSVLQPHASDNLQPSGTNYELMTGAIDLQFNETGLDKVRGNTQVQVLASGARTTTQTSADLINYNHRGLHVILDMTTVGTGSVTITINAKDPTSGKYYLLLAGAAVVTNSTNIYKVYPGLTAAANAVATDILPRTFQIVVTANNANSATYSVAYSLVL